MTEDRISVGGISIDFRRISFIFRL